VTYILPTLMAWAAYLAWERHMDCDCGAHLERNALGYFDCVFCGVSW
jgi:hypothetical protein